MRMMKTRSNIIVALILIVLVSSVAFAQGGDANRSRTANHEGRSRQRQSAC